MLIRGPGSGSPTTGAGWGCGGAEGDSPGGELWLWLPSPPFELPEEPDESLPEPSSRMTVEPSSCVVLAGGSVGCGAGAGCVAAAGVVAGGAGTAVAAAGGVG